MSNIQINGNLSNSIITNGNNVTINGVKLPPAPCAGNNSTVINGKIYLDGYEFVNGEWKRTLTALWHLFF